MTITDLHDETRVIWQYALKRVAQKNCGKQVWEKWDTIPVFHVNHPICT